MGSGQTTAITFTFLPNPTEFAGYAWIQLKNKNSNSIDLNFAVPVVQTSISTISFAGKTNYLIFFFQLIPNLK